MTIAVDNVQGAVFWLLYVNNNTRVRKIKETYFQKLFGLIRLLYMCV